ncbi:MAG TPA: amidohydrolase family protein [Vicinamibacterales bacterium]|nr:amidohydrolase family protein [Vicinamibacterales bacterium]
MFTRSVLALVGAQLTEIRRSKTALFWMMAFPLGFLFLFGFVMARGDARVMAVLMPGLLTTTLMSGGLFGVALPLVQQREAGLLRRLHVTPVAAAAVAVAHGITAILTGFLSLVILLVIATLVFKLQIAGSWLALAGVFLCGACALIPLGLVVGSTARDMRTAPAIANLLFFPLMFLSGSAMPFAVLPEGVKRFARLLPTTYLVDTYSSVIVRGDGLGAIAGSLAVLIGIGAVGIVLTSMLFRWEGTEPISRKALATITVAFAAVLSVSAFAAPAFRMGELPGARTIEAGAAKGQVLVLRGATVLDGLGGRITNARIVIRDHRIAEVLLDDERVPMPEGATVEDVHGRYVIPGLFDSHVHWGGSGGIGTAPVEMTDERMTRDFGATLAAGVTSVLSLTDDLADMRSLSAAVAAARERAPRTFFAGPSITAKGGHPSEMFSFLPGLAEKLTRQVETPEEARAAIAELDRERVDIVKLVLEPGFKDRPLPRLREEVFLAAMAEAKARKMRTTVHVGTDADARLAVEAGANGLEHAARGLSESTIALMAAKRVTFTPTNVVVDYAWKAQVAGGADALARRLVHPAILRSLLDPASPMRPFLTDGDMATRMAQAFAGSIEQTSRAIRAGVPILAGSDAGNPVTFHGISLIRELELLAQAGMPLGDVLKSATSRAADRLNQSTLGRIGAGAVADLVVLESDPTERIDAYRQVVSVFLGGRKLVLRELTESSPGPWRPGIR